MKSKKILKEYIKKSRRDRLYYELSDLKKRKNAIGRFYQNAVDHIDNCEIKYQGINMEKGLELIRRKV